MAVTVESPSKILIIGAGIAGLSLAQGLKQHKIPFRIFERDSSASFRAQGYRIRISPDGANALRRLLPQQLFATFEATCGILGSGFGRFDAFTAEPAQWNRAAPPMPVGKSYNTDRAVLRSILLSGLEDDVSFGNRFDVYEIDENDGGIVVHFADGTSEQGKCLIGADGVRSAVRRQLLPNMKILDTEGRAVFGKTPIDQGAQVVMPELLNGISLVGADQESRLKLFCDAMRFDRAQCAPHGEDHQLQIPEDYLYWVLVFRKDIITDEDEKDMHSFNSTQSAQKAIDMTSAWAEDFRYIFQQQLRDAASTLSFLTASPAFSEIWAAKSRSSVTLIGDAAHPMPPVGGFGANVALEDAADLFDTLSNTSSSQDVGQLVKKVAEYEELMRKRSEKSVSISAQGAGHFFGMKPIEDLKIASW